MKRFRIEIDIETDDYANERGVRRWLEIHKDSREWPKVITSVVVQTYPETRT